MWLLEDINEASGALRVLKRPAIHLFDDEGSILAETKQLRIPINGSTFREVSNENQTYDFKYPARSPIRRIEATELDSIRLQLFCLAESHGSI